MSTLLSTNNLSLTYFTIYCAYYFVHLERGYVQAAVGSACEPRLGTRATKHCSHERDEITPNRRSRRFKNNLIPCSQRYALFRGSISIALLARASDRLNSSTRSAHTTPSCPAIRHLSSRPAPPIAPQSKTRSSSRHSQTSSPTSSPTHGHYGTHREREASTAAQRLPNAWQQLNAPYPRISPYTACTATLS